VLRQLERWLHQHIFKVGWLLTKNFQTTTILYYTFFLPGVALNQFVVWLTAGIVNVRAERAIQWPEPQEVAELRLDFIRLAKGAGRFRLAVIAISPLVAGIVVIWLIASQVLGAASVMHAVSSDSISVIEAIRQLSTAPDFWLWAYLVFTIGNTMMPDPRNLRGFRVILWPTAAAIAVVVVLGVGSEVLGALLVGPLAEALNLLSSTFAVIIAVDLLAVACLGTLEALIERFTGDSATFEKGKLVAVTRRELLEQKRKQAARAAQARSRPALEAGPPSIYRLPLPIPGPPGRETVSQSASAVISPFPQQVETSPSSFAAPRDDRAEPAVVESKAQPRPLTEPVPQQPSPFSPISSPPDKADDDNDGSDDSDNITYVDIEELA